MGKSKKFNPNKSFKQSKYESVLGSDDERDHQNNDRLDEMSNSDNDSNELNDEIEKFNNNRDNELFRRSALSQNLDFDYESDSNEEIMPIDSADESSDDSNTGLNRFEVQLKKDEMASDLEDNDHELDDINSNAWGKKKSVFYNTDYVDKDFKKYEQKEEDLAQYEEEEALAIQRRLLESMTESDIGIELLIGEYEPKTVSQNQSINEDKEEDEEKLETNLSTLTKRQKIEILKKESPELEALINDFRTYMNEIRDRLHPIMLLIRDGKVRDSMGFKYIETKYQIIINYCVNICFYLVLKSKRIPVKDHPIIKQLLSYKKLLLELNSITSNNSSINEDIDLVLEKLSKGEDIKFFRKRFNQNKRKSEETKDRLKKVKFADNLEMNETLAEDEELDSESNAQLSKRGITYEIAKNKGLTPKRKKELKNPRVKHRMKYRKAKIRRKGQVREPRKELQRYGGEISGIKSGVVKSIKFK